MNDLFYLPEDLEPDYTPVGEPFRVVDVLYPDASPEERDHTERNMIRNLAIAEDDAIADLMLSGKQFLSEEDYFDQKLFVRKAILIVNRMGDHDFFEEEVTEAVKQATTRYYEGKRNVR
jgi:hypothetical protein